LGGIIPSVKQKNFWEKNVPLPKGKVDIFITMTYIITSEQLNTFIKKFYGPLKMESGDNGRYMVWYNRDGEKVFELTGGTDISIRKNYFYSLIDFLNLDDSDEKSIVMKALYKYFGELSGRKILDIMTF
jgi:hypothetical protein